MVWGEQALGLPIHDNWWQTETGGIMIANYAAWISGPVPWAVRCRGSRRPSCAADRGEVARRDRRGRHGPDDRAIWRFARAGPPCSAAISTSEERYRKCFVDGWYMTGDLAKQDADGYFWFVGRADDVIKSSGHLVGPFEVESALIEHPAVAEAGVIGKPDP